LNKISKKDLIEVERVRNDVRDAEAGVEDAVASYNEALEERWTAVQTACETLEAARSDAASVVEGLASQMADYMDARSEAWQESDRGSDYQCWHDTWESAQGFCEGYETLSKPEPLDATDVLGAADELDNLAESPEG